MDIRNAGYVHRQIEKTLRKTAEQFPAVSLTGPRQSGKSTLLRTLFGHTHNIVSFDDPVTRERALSDPKLFIDSIGHRIILDEIQYVPQILSYIKILIDNNRSERGRFIITGSQQFNLIKNLGETLAGRIAILDLLPFGINEQRQIPFLQQKLSGAKNCFVHSCIRGSFPELSVHPDIDSNIWYGSYLQTYLERDIKAVFDVGMLRDFQQFMRLLATRCSQVLNLSSFASDLGISVNTIKKWLSLLEACRMIFILPPYYQNFGKRVTKSPKVYFLDSGMVCYLTGIKTGEQLLYGPLAGALFENFIIQETVKFFFHSGITPGMYYLRANNDVEIDLIIESNLRLFPFEIKLTKTPNTRMADPMEKAMKVFDKLKINSGKIISLSEEDMPLTNAVSIITFDNYISGLNGFL